jgi:hypothetical protein
MLAAAQSLIIPVHAASFADDARDVGDVHADLLSEQGLPGNELEAHISAIMVNCLVVSMAIPARRPVTNSPGWLGL